MLGTWAQHGKNSVNFSALHKTLLYTWPSLKISLLHYHSCAASAKCFVKEKASCSCKQTCYNFCLYCFSNLMIYDLCSKCCCFISGSCKVSCFMESFVLSYTALWQLLSTSWNWLSQKTSEACLLFQILWTDNSFISISESAFRHQD